MPKIAILGSHSTGKTTLSTMLAHELGLSKIPDVVIKSKVEESVKADEDTDQKTQMKFFESYRDIEKTMPNYVSDKAFYDFYIYAQVIFGNCELAEKLKRLSLELSHYDQLFYLPIEFAIEDNGLRSIDPVFQKNVDTVYRAFLAEQKIDHIQLSGSIESRLSKALKHL